MKQGLTVRVDERDEKASASGWGTQTQETMSLVQRPKLALPEKYWQSTKRAGDL